MTYRPATVRLWALSRIVGTISLCPDCYSTSYLPLAQRLVALAAGSDAPGVIAPEITS